MINNATDDFYLEKIDEIRELLKNE